MRLSPSRCRTQDWAGWGLGHAHYYGRSVAGVGDLNGDGRMEIAINGAYYEGSWTAIHDYINDDLGPWEVLAVGCGS